MEKECLNKIKTSVKSVAVDQKSVDKYLKIQDLLMNVYVSKDLEFQKLYKGFYRVRRNDQWCEIYFDLLQQQKKSPKSFSEILKALHEKTGRFEASFASKLIATVDPNSPVWDSIVLENTGLSVPAYNLPDNERLDSIISTYDKLRAAFDELSKLDEIKEAIKDFDEKINRSNEITITKKIDFILWSIRE